MLRSEIEVKMKQCGLDHLGIVYNENDELGVYCSLKSGILMDYTDHRIDRKKDIWGAIVYENGKPKKVSFKDFIWENKK